MIRCAICTVPLLFASNVCGGLCAFCYGTQKRTQDIINGNIQQCGVCNREVFSGKIVYWKVKGKYERKHVHPDCGEVARFRATYREDDPAAVPRYRKNNERSDARKVWSKQMPIYKPERLKLKPSMWFYFGKDRRGGFCLGKLVEAKEIQLKSKDYKTPLTNIDTRTQHDGIAVDIRVTCTEMGVWDSIKGHIQGTPKSPSIIGQHIGIVSIGVPEGEKYGQCIVAVNNTIQGVIDDLMAESEIVKIANEIAEWELTGSQIWYPGIEADVARFASDNPGALSDDIPF